VYLHYLLIKADKKKTGSAPALVTATETQEPVEDDAAGDAEDDDGGEDTAGE
jgi:hypothetical protein